MPAYFYARQYVCIMCFIEVCLCRRHNVLAPCHVYKHSNKDMYADMHTAIRTRLFARAHLVRETHRLVVKLDNLRCMMHMLLWYAARLPSHMLMCLRIYMCVCVYIYTYIYILLWPISFLVFWHRIMCAA